MRRGRGCGTFGLTARWSGSCAASRSGFDWLTRVEGLIIYEGDFSGWSGGGWLVTGLRIGLAGFALGAADVAEWNYLDVRFIIVIGCSRVGPFAALWLGGFVFGQWLAFFVAFKKLVLLLLFGLFDFDFFNYKTLVYKLNWIHLDIRHVKKL